MSTLISDKEVDSLIKNCISSGMLSVDDVVNSSKEDAMKSILKTVHRSTISKGKDGRWATYVPDAMKPDGRRLIKRKSKSDLYKTLISIYGLTEKTTEKTFGELYLEWVNYKKQFVGAPNSKKSLSPTTIHRYQLDYDKYIKGTNLDQDNIKNITVTGLETFILEVISTHQMSDRCAGNLFGYLNQAFTYAKRSKYITETPMEFIDKRLLLSKCIVPPAKEDEERVLTKEEVAALRIAIRKHLEKIPGYLPDYAIELALLTGMRLGELAALKWSCIDDLFIRIDFSEHRLDFENKKSEFVVGEPKNRKHRKIPLTKDIRALVKEIRAIKPVDEKGFVFTNASGERYLARAIGDAATKRFKEAGIEHGSIHRIRRTVSSMLNQILPQKDVAALLGHTETVNEMYYNYSTADTAEKKKALSHLSSVILTKVG